MKHGDFYISIILFVLTFTFTACHENQSQTSPTIPKPGKRNYSWSIDTLSYPTNFQTMMVSIWGTSPNDLYAVGLSDQNTGTMYYYDGVHWKPIKLTSVEGGPINAIVGLAQVFGFNSDDIWVVGNEEIYDAVTSKSTYVSLILHWKFGQWSKASITLGKPLKSVWGNMPDNVWASGEGGTLYHFNGIDWFKIPIDSSVSLGRLYGFSSSDIYCTGAKSVDKGPLYDSTEYILYHYNGNNWSPIDSFLFYNGSFGDKFGFADIWGPNNSTLYTIGRGIFLRNGNSWINTFASPYLYSSIYGTGADNIFAVGPYNSVVQFNGIDWYQFNSILNSSIFASDVWCNEAEVFVVSNDGRNTFVFHGR